VLQLIATFTYFTYVQSSSRVKSNKQHSLKGTTPSIAAGIWALKGRNCKKMSQGPRVWSTFPACTYVEAAAKTLGSPEGSREPRRFTRISWPSGSPDQPRSAQISPDQPRSAQISPDQPR